MANPKPAPGTKVRLSSEFKRDAGVNGSAHEFAYSIGVVEAYEEDFAGADWPEVAVRWWPSKLRYGYLPEELVAADSPGWDGMAVCDGRSYRLRDFPYRTEDGTVLNLEDGTNFFLEGKFYPDRVRYGEGSGEELDEWQRRALRAERELEEICQCLRTHQNEDGCEREKCGCRLASASELVADRLMARGNSHEVSQCAFPIGPDCSLGMTYREWLAGIIMAGLAGKGGAREAVERADWLIAELNRTSKEKK